MPLISVHYEGPSPEVSEAIARGRPVRPDTPVALFRHGEDQLFVRARHVSPFVDLDARTITGTLWPLFLDATCAHVTLAPRISDAPAELDLAARFTPASGGPDTLASVAEADRLLLHEVMGLGYHASWRQRARWSERLDIHLDDPEPLALQLVAQGCYGAYEWSPDRPALRSLYGRLSLATRLRCAATTAALREPFLSHLCDALSAPHTTRIHRRGDMTLTAHRLDEELEVWSSRQHIIDVVGNPARLTTSRRVWQSRRHLGWTITPTDPPPTDLRAQLEAGGPWHHEVAPADVEDGAWHSAAANPHGSLHVGDVVADLQDAVLDSASRAVRQLAYLIDQGDLMLRRATSLRTHAQDALAGELERAVDGLRHDLQHHEAWVWLAGSGPSHPDPASLWASVPSAPAAALPDLHIEVGEDAMTQVATGEAPHGQSGVSRSACISLMCFWRSPRSVRIYSSSRMQRPTGHSP